MLQFKKYMSLFLALLMLCGALTGLSVLNVSAAEANSGTTSGEEKDDAETRTAHYHTTQYPSPEDKLAAMKKWSTKGNYTIYADQKSGEVAVKDMITGQVLFSNPYDIGYSSATESIKNELMSQIIVTFTEVGNDNKKIYNSFEQAAAKDQIKIKNIKNGIRVEYTIGREEARRLVPRSIEETRFKELILEPMGEYYGVSYEEAKRIIENKEYSHPMYSQAFYFHKQINYYEYKSLDNAVSEAMKKDMVTMYPVLADMNIYILESTVSTNEVEKIEQVIKVACPDYSYEEMDYDHQMTEYTSEEDTPPLFKMALEYTIDETGFTVRLPANGIRFNESAFEIHNLQILPYMGAGNNNYEGYAFFPDGSGALFTFEDMKINSPNGESISAKIYGEDYAYHNLEMKYQQTTTYPVYGIVENTVFYDFVQYDETLGEEVVTTVNAVAYNIVKTAMEEGTTDSLSDELKAIKDLIDNAEMTERVEKRGFAAVIEEGEALAGLTYTHSGTLNEYDAIAMYCNPRPRDEYNLADAISVGNNTKVSVVTDRKYVGSYKIHVTLLADDAKAEQAIEAGLIKAGDRYEASWMGMAMAYRDRLVSKGQLTALDANSVTDNVPLYIESFGAMETVEKILSVPVEVKRPLTSAEDVFTMYKELSKQGVANINFKLTGFANGGMYASVPYGLKWESAVSKEMSMQELFDEAAASNGQLGVYPDFDFSYATDTSKLFDGFSMRKHAVRTIDDRYAYKREYMATQQKYDGYYQLAISPAYFEHFYTKFMKKYLAYDNLTGISVGSLGSALNSDFDEDEPFNREDAKGFVSSALEFISNPENNLQVMVDGGNAYTWKYVDHILNAPIDSSRYLAASYSVPFLGVVLHGYVNFTGSPLNMEGDVSYAKLKAIENGASVYFTLSYQNTQNLKDDENLSQYYSVRYDIWFDDVVEIYNELNAEMADLQTMLITNHEFLGGVRVPDTDELDRDLEEEFKEIMNFQDNQLAFLEQRKSAAVAEARQHIYTMGETIKNMIKNSTGYYAGGSGVTNATSQYLSNGVMDALANYRTAYAELEAVKADNSATAEELTVAAEALEKCQRNLTRAISGMAKNIIKIQNAISEIDAIVETAEEGRALILSLGDECPANIKVEVEKLYAEAIAYRDAMTGMDFSYTGESIALQTFLEIQYMLAIGELEGAENHSEEAVVGLLEKQFLAIYEGDFGLVKDPATYIMLRYLSANSKLTDAQLDEKYGLTTDGTSMDGLVQYVRELLGDDIALDPVLSEDQADAQIIEYIKNKFLIKLNGNDYKLLGREDKTALALSLQYLNLNPYKTGTTVINNIELYAALSRVHNALGSLVGSKGKIHEITDGDYRLENVLTEEELNELVDQIDSVLASSERSGKIEYLTPATRKADIRNYIEVYYYAKVLVKVVPAAEPALPVVKTTSTSLDSLNILLADRINAFGVTMTAPGARLETYYTGFEADLAFAFERVAAISALLAPYYGDVTYDLWSQYIVLFVNHVMANEKEPVALKAGRSEEKSASANTKELQERAEALLEEKLSLEMSDADIGALIEELVALHAEYPEVSGYDAEDASKAYVYYELFSLMSDYVAEMPAVHSYFYNDDLAAMDAMLLTAVDEKKTTLVETLGEDYTSVEYIGAVLNVLAGEDIQDTIDAATAKISKYATVSQKRTLRDDVTDYYTYLLLNCLQSATMSDVAAAYESAVIKEINTFMAGRTADLLAKARRAGNYSMDVFMTELELSTLVDEAYAALSATAFDSALSLAERKAQVEEMVKYAFYTEAIKSLNGATLVNFNLYQIYAGTLEESYVELKNLAKYYAIAFTNMSEDIPEGAQITEEMFENCFEVKEIVEDEEDDEEESRYVSDDGRIVAVTYGQKTENGTYAAYKTFILNYNNFSIQVVYDNTVYTIPAYGYVTVYANN